MPRDSKRTREDRYLNFHKKRLSDQNRLNSTQRENQLEDQALLNPELATPSIFQEQSSDSSHSLFEIDGCSSIHPVEQVVGNFDDSYFEIDDNEQRQDTTVATPLYTSLTPFFSPISNDDFCCLMIAYQRCNNAPNTAMDGICQMFKKLLPSSNSCPSSFKVLQRIVTNLAGPRFQFVSSKSKLCGNCFNKFDKACVKQCQGTGRHSPPVGLITCSIEKQLQIILNTYGTKILAYLRDTKIVMETEGVYTDLITGELYRSLQPKFKDGELHLHLVLNSDGAMFSKAKAGGFWPLVSILAELPRKIRTKFQNSILLAFWQGESKPNWNIFFKVCYRIFDKTPV